MTRKLMKLEYMVTLKKMFPITAYDYVEAFEIAESKMAGYGLEIDKIDLVGPLPDKWEVGMKVMYRRNIKWGPLKGDIGTINKIEEKYIGRKASEYQVFFVTLDEGCGSFFTTPQDVVLCME